MTLVLLTLTDLTASEYVVLVDQLLVKQVNKQRPGLIPTNIDVNSSAKSWLAQQNLWNSVVSPHLRKEQDVDKSLLIARQAIGHLTTIILFLNDCIFKLLIASDTKYKTKDILGQKNWLICRLTYTIYKLGGNYR